MASSIWWIRRDLRLDDNPALQAALADGAVLPVYVHAPEEETPWAPGAASQAWLRQSLLALNAALQARGSRLILRRGPSLPALLALARDAGATAVHWNRVYEPALVARDTAVKNGLSEQGLQARSHPGSVWAEPWQIATDAGAAYRVFTPFWRRLRTLLDGLPGPHAAPPRLGGAPGLGSVALDELLPAPRPAWDRSFWQHWQPGEAGAQGLLEAFLEGAAHGYRAQRDRPDRIGTSRLSPHLHFGEITPRRMLQRIKDVRWSASVEADVEGYLRELGWREFSIHLLYHFPHSASQDLNPGFERFDWAAPDEAVLEAWRHGRTGIPLVDAGMRELWQTGWMHNRVRMVVASFLTKNLRVHWRHGARWFWDTLVDADLANNTQGWQWTAGTGADAAPYFRIFNPVTQARRFDPQGRYVRRWVPELADLPEAALFTPWEHPDYPSRPLVDLKDSRAAALHAYQRVRRG